MPRETALTFGWPCHPTRSITVPLEGSIRQEEASETWAVPPMYRMTLRLLPALPGLSFPSTP